MAKKKKDVNALGSLAFLLAVVLAVILGALDGISPGVASILVILGLLVGLLNVSQGESKEFLISGTILVIVSFLGGGTLKIVPAVAGIFDGLLMVFVPATALVALKQMLNLARS